MYIYVRENDRRARAREELTRVRSAALRDSSCPRHRAAIYVVGGARRHGAAAAAAARCNNERAKQGLRASSLGSFSRTRKRERATEKEGARRASRERREKDDVQCYVCADAATGARFNGAEDFEKSNELRTRGGRERWGICIKIISSV